MTPSPDSKDKIPFAYFGYFAVRCFARSAVGCASGDRDAGGGVAGHGRALAAELAHTRTHAAHLLQAVLKEAFTPAT